MLAFDSRFAVTSEKEKEMIDAYFLLVLFFSLSWSLIADIQFGYNQHR